MEIFEKILSVISGFISGTLTWFVVVLIIFFVCKKPIMKKIESLIAIEITKNGFITKIIFRFVENIIAIKEGQKRQINQHLTSITEESDPLKLEIILIYSEIETAVKKKFGVTDIYNMFVTLSNKGKIDATTLIMLSSMELLRDEILSSTSSPKITRKYIDNYRYNADRIIKIIQEIEN